jgi:hypothetical protein
MSEPLSVSEQRALGLMSGEWIAEHFHDGLDGAWRTAPEYRETVSEVETADDRAARELGDLERRHARERAALQAKHEGHS